MPFFTRIIGVYFQQKFYRSYSLLIVTHILNDYFSGLLLFVIQTMSFMAIYLKIRQCQGIINQCILYRRNGLIKLLIIIVLTVDLLAIHCLLFFKIEDILPFIVIYALSFLFLLIYFRYVNYSQPL